MQSGAAVGKQATPQNHGTVPGGVVRADLECELRARADNPFREVQIDIPLHTEAGVPKLVRAWRVLHSNSRGPAIGEFCLDPTMTRERVLSAAAFNSWAAAVAGVPFGGSYGAIACDEKSLTEFEREVLLRRYVSSMHHVLGPYQDVVMIEESLADLATHCVLNEFGSVEGLAVLTAKKPMTGGLADFQQAAARGVIGMLSKLAEESIAGEGLRIAVRNIESSVGAALARVAVRMGLKVVAVSDSRLMIHDDRGIDVEAAVQRLASTGTVACDGLVVRAASHLWSCDCNALIAVGDEQEFTPAQAMDLKAAIFVEASRALMTTAAESMLLGRNVVVLPDLLAVSTKLAAAHEEWSQNLEGLSRAQSRVEEEVERVSLRALSYAKARAKQDALSLRAASYELALERVARMEKLRGL